mgnify:CR=1 FL=1
MATTPQYTRVLLRREAAEQRGKQLHSAGWKQVDPCRELLLNLETRMQGGAWGTTGSWCARKSGSEMFAENLKPLRYLLRYKT